MKNSPPARTRTKTKGAVERGTTPLAELVPADYNPRKIDPAALEGLSESLRRFGVVQEIVVNRRTGRIVGGHQRVEALKALGEHEAPVAYVDLDEHDERALNVALNSHYISGEFELAPLQEILQGIDEELSTALRFNEFGLTEAPEVLPPEPTPEDGALQPEGSPDSQHGEVYQLGPHRLICGNSQDPEVVAALLDGMGEVKSVITDPPYNLGGKNDMLAKGIRDGYADLADADWDQDFNILPTLDILESVLDPAGASVYIFTSHHLAGEIWAWMDGALEHSAYCVWEKTNPMPSLAKRHWTGATELVCYGTTQGHTFNFPDKGHLPNVWRHKSIGGTKKAQRTGHPTEKPVGLIKIPLEASTGPGDLVLDLFGGSGSTLIAAAEAGRVAAVAELSPSWCDSIRRRWTLSAENAGVDPGEGALR